MRSLFAFLGAALVAFFALGWFLDWYKVSSTPSDAGRRQVKLDLNIPKIGEDFKAGEKKAIQVIENVKKKETPAASTASATDNVILPLPAPGSEKAGHANTTQKEEELRIVPPEIPGSK